MRRNLIRIMKIYLFEYAKVFFTVCCLDSCILYVEGSLQEQYIGCYYDTSSQSNWTTSIQNSNTLTIGICIQKCREIHGTYAILHSGSNCLCGDALNVTFPDDKCNILCSGSASEVCGGGSKQDIAYIIYAVCPIGYYGAGCDRVCHCKQQIPCYRVSGICPIGCEENWTNETCSIEATLTDRYIGCYNDMHDDRVMTLIGDGGENTIEYCSELCASNSSSTYAGLQFSRQCFCGESYDRHGAAPPNSCISACSGNPNQKCGAAWVSSVYSVCPRGSYGTDCVLRCNCRNNSICTYATGDCNFACEAGWSGHSCNIRNCSVDNGACSVNESCVTVDLKFATVTRCQCSQGYHRTHLWDRCIGRSSSTCTGFQTSSDNYERVYSVVDVIGAAVGAAGGMAVIFAVIIIIVLLCRRRRKHNKQLEDATRKQHKEESDAKIENPISLSAYETLTRRPKSDDLSYTELSTDGNQSELMESSNNINAVAHCSTVYENAQ